MSPNNLVAGPPDTTKTPRGTVVSFGQKFLHQVTWLGLCAGGGVSGTLLILAVLTILSIGQPHPTPTPSPLPF
jgi:hypothetical protein